MRDVFVAADNILSPLGFSTAENIESLRRDMTGIRLVSDRAITQIPLYASMIDSTEIDAAFEALGASEPRTRLEKLLILSVSEALRQTHVDCADPDTLIVLSTIKGNIDLLEGDRGTEFGPDRIYLWKLAEIIQRVFHASRRPVVISNACISGVLAINCAARFIQRGEFRNVIVCGGDIISEFVASGFQSLHSLSQGPCRPFDKNRTGLSLGEACGTMVLTSEVSLIAGEERVLFVGGSTSNDANHISGPSRTGEGLYKAILQTIEEAKRHSVTSFDHISAHGTGTLFNDESEALAISRAGLETVPLNSLKGYWGHTLGAAGVIESIVAVRSLKGSFLINTLGYRERGVSSTVNIITKYMERPVHSCLKTASGFGGCNAAAAFVRRS